MQDCCSQPGLMPIETARSRLLASVKPLTELETIPLEHALGRILGEMVHSAVDLPPCDNSAMDGYALHAADLQTNDTEKNAPLQLIGKSFAGAPFNGEVQPGTCVRIMTGAALPAGADAVEMQENVRADGDQIRIGGTVRSGQHIRRRGEDVAAGQILLERGTRISVAQIALLAAAGIGAVNVLRRPVVALFSTGDELREPGSTLGPGDIYDSNRVALKSALAALNLEILDLGILPDDKDTIARALEDAAHRADAIVTSGGVSVGEADYTREVLDELGEIDFWKVAMKPGKPFAFGHIRNTPFFGLPGNPVSALVTFYQLAVPALAAIAGGGEQRRSSIDARLLAPVRKQPGRTDFQRGIYRYRENAEGQREVVVETVGSQGSHILTGLAAANCFIVLARECGNLAAGARVEIEPFAPALT